MITKEQTTKVINWLNNNLVEINSGNESHSYWRLRCSKELGFVVSASTYNNRLHQIKYNKVPKDYSSVLTYGTGTRSESTETIVESNDPDLDSFSEKWLEKSLNHAEVMLTCIYELKDGITRYRIENKTLSNRILNLAAKLSLEVENNRKLANSQSELKELAESMKKNNQQLSSEYSQASQNQIDNQAKIIATLKDDKNKEFIRLSNIIAEQKDELLKLRSECEMLRDKVNDLEITKAVSKNSRSFKEFGFNFNIPQPSCNF